MTCTDNCNTAREVHKLLAEAKPHKDDIGIAKAATLAFGMSGDDQAQERTFLAIQRRLAAALALPKARNCFWKQLGVLNAG